MQQVFQVTLDQMLVFFIMMVVGFVLSKKRILPENSDITLSRLLANIIAPVLTFETFSAKFNLETLREKFLILICGVVILFVLIILAHFLSKLFSKDRYIRYLYNYSLIVSNLGYLGYPLALAVFGQDALFDMMMFCIPFNIYICSFGVAMMNPNNQKITLKSFATPPFFMLGLGIIFGLFKIPIPGFVEKTLASVSGCMGAVAMLLTGFVIARYDIKKMLLNVKVYILTAFRLIAIPAVFVAIIKFMGLPSYVYTSVLCTLAMPMGLNTVVFPAAYGGDALPGASMALISNLIGIITIPLMFSAFLT